MSQDFDVPLSNTRNVTIVAHVDHGKTSFADSLLSSNNIISSRMAGKLRFLDSREDEQERGITMESSAVSLRFDMMRTGSGGCKFNDGRKAGFASADAFHSDLHAASTSKHLCNVIDTPGHVDFASEVSTASRLCDGALVLVDVWEGVQTQTISVLRQCWIDRLRPVLVINKMDRLITELKLSPIEAYHHLSRLIEQVNAVMGSFYASERMEDDLRWREEREKRLAERATREGDEPMDANGSKGEGEAGEGAEGDTEAGYEEKEDEDLYFAPERGNVLFASAIDGWAFRLGKFARLYAEKLGVKEGNLRRALWGDYFLDPKTKRVVGRKKLAGRALKPLFVQFVLENIWKVYETLLGDYNPDAVTKIVSALNVRVSPRDVKSKDTRNLLTLIMQQWLPLSTATFQAVVDIIPPPDVAQTQRMPFMLLPELAVASSTPLQPQNTLEEGLYSCVRDVEAQVVGYVSKMFAVARGDLPEFRKREMTAEEMRQRGKEEREKRAAAAAVSSAAGSVPQAHSNGISIDGIEGLTGSLQDLSVGPPSELQKSDSDRAQDIEINDQAESSEVLLAFSRIFSGTIRRNTKLLATLPKYSPDLPPDHPRNIKFVKTVHVKEVYMMMGRELVAVGQVQAGQVCAIAGMEGIVHRNATLWAPSSLGLQEDTQPEKLVNLAGVITQASPIVRVALEPENPADMPKLVKGLQILDQSDPCAEYLVQETGEHVILTAGELHLERCLKDLRERFAKCPIQRSQTIVPFRETAVRGVDMAPPKTAGMPRGTVQTNLLGILTYTIRAIPLPPAISEFLLSHTTTIRRLVSQHTAQADDRSEDDHADVDVDADGTAEQTHTQAQEQARSLTPEQFWEELEAVCRKAGGEWVGAADRIWSFGPKRMGSCLLLDPQDTQQLRLRGRSQLIAKARAEGATAEQALATTESAVVDQQMATLGDHLGSSPVDETTLDEAMKGQGLPADATKADLRLLQDFETSIEAGFQMATFQGPLCAEPVVGMAWVVEKIEIQRDSEGNNNSRMSAVVGALISSVREACRNGMLDWSPRIKLAMYTCDIQASTDVLGKVYAVVARRRGRIVSEEMKEGTSFFTIRAMLPVIESFGFADEIRKRTSGAASPQLIFSGFETLDLDPFWVPTTVEELEDLGEKADRANVAKLYVDNVRKRKGMFVEKKLVEAAEKQRTLKR
ncbi:translation elongation factor 2 [Kockovaella imperatae]|uniref:Elongation factor-like 1 n=1 Tax=Kockovaella imperatae TaxID=4999 RepID=A0A1Y1UHC0_9TREE|nr:translation elongation factor 2 [Kockovaella imperatae]ORX36874.1 translation elongation factor 2 [Kockovaella imperatae]